MTAPRPYDRIDEAALRSLVDLFYARVRRDPLIGPVFNTAVDDWPGHLDRLHAFWSSVMLTSGRYKGRPLAAHLKHGGSMTSERFERWLALWRQTTDELFGPEDAAALQAKAERIAESLSLGLAVARGELLPTPSGAPASLRPSP